MNRAIFILLLLLTLGVGMSIFMKKITADVPVTTADTTKTLINILNDSPEKKPIRIYRGLSEKSAGAGILVNPGKKVAISIGSKEKISIYTPKKNATYHISLNEIAKNEEPKTINTSVKELEKISQQNVRADQDHTEEYGEGKYLYVEEEIIPPYGSYGTMPY